MDLITSDDHLICSAFESLASWTVGASAVVRAVLKCDLFLPFPLHVEEMG
jgi:hypothetical protein